MGLESATFIHELVSTNPIGGSDPKSQGDDHIRLLKSTLQNTFANVDGAVTTTHTELNKLAGVTATTAELNKLAGLTATTAELNKLAGTAAGLTAAELNILDGLLASTAELNFVDGVTSNIQTQLNSKTDVASGTFTGTLSGMTGSVTDTFNYLRVGKLTMLWRTGAAPLTGTSNQTFMTLDGIPAAAGEPVANVESLCTGSIDNGGTTLSNVQRQSATSLIFNRYQVSGSNITINSTFTNSGTKGLPAEWSCIYPNV